MEPLFPMHSLLAELLLPVIKKLPPKEFTRLLRSCKAFNLFCLSRKNLVRMNILLLIFNENGQRLVKINDHAIIEYSSHWEDLLLFRVTCSQIFVSIPVTSSVLQEMFTIAENLQLTSDSLWVESLADCDELPAFIKMMGISSITINVLDRATRPELLRTVRKIDILETTYGDQEIVRLNQESIDIQWSEITNEGIKSLIRRWLTEELHFDHMLLGSYNELSAEEIVSGLPLSLLYNESSHGSSLLHSIPINALSPSIRQTSYYIMFRPADVFNFYALSIEEKFIEIDHCSDPSLFLLNQLSPLDKLILFG